MNEKNVIRLVTLVLLGVAAFLVIKWIESAPEASTNPPSAKNSAVVAPQEETTDENFDPASPEVREDDSPSLTEKESENPEPAKQLSADEVEALKLRDYKSYLRYKRRERGDIVDSGDSAEDVNRAEERLKDRLVDALEKERP